MIWTRNVDVLGPPLYEIPRKVGQDQHINQRVLDRLLSHKEGISQGHTSAQKQTISDAPVNSTG